MDSLPIDVPELTDQERAEIERDMVCLQINGEPSFTDAEYPAVLAERQRAGHVLSAQELKTFLEALRAK